MPVYQKIDKSFWYLSDGDIKTLAEQYLTPKSMEGKSPAQLKKTLDAMEVLTPVEDLERATEHHRWATAQAALALEARKQLTLAALEEGEEVRDVLESAGVNFHTLKTWVGADVPQEVKEAIAGHEAFLEKCRAKKQELLSFPSAAHKKQYDEAKLRIQELNKKYSGKAPKDWAAEDANEKKRLHEFVNMAAPKKRLERGWPKDWPKHENF